MRLRRLIIGVGALAILAAGAGYLTDRVQANVAYVEIQAASDDAALKLTSNRGKNETRLDTDAKRFFQAALEPSFVGNTEIIQKRATNPDGSLIQKVMVIAHVKTAVGSLLNLPPVDLVASSSVKFMP